VCTSGYSDCAPTEAYYNSKGPGLDVVAERYGKNNYGATTLAWQVSMEGCLAALQDEYMRLDGGG
jgi:hypothetical protein